MNEKEIYHETCKNYHTEESFKPFLKEKFEQWMVTKGRTKYESTDVFVNNDGDIKIEKKMAWIIKTSPDDWREFCNENGIDYEQVQLLAIY